MNYQIVDDPYKEQSIANEDSQVSGTSSANSIISSDFLRRHQYGVIRESKENRQDKKVWIWSPFTIGQTFTRETKKGIRYKYVHG